MKVEEPLKSVAIYLRGYDLDPEYVSQKLGMSPSRTQKKGDLKTGSARFIAKLGIWTIKVKSESRSLQDLVDELLQKVGNPAMRLDKVRGVEDAHLDILFAFGDETKHTIEFALTKNQIAKISQLGLSICATVM